MRALIASLLLTLAACSPEADEKPGSFESWLQERQQRADRGDGSWEAISAGSWAVLPIERLRLERNIGHRLESVQLEFERGGAATREGGILDWPNPEGLSFSGEVPYWEFARLCWLIESLQPDPASATWFSGVSHGEGLVVSWTTRDGRRFELNDYGSAGPPAVAALAAALETAGRRIEWAAGEPDDAEAAAPR